MTEKIYPNSSWNLPPTGKQVRALVRLGVQDADIPTTRWEARRVLYELNKKRKREQNAK